MTKDFTERLRHRGIILSNDHFVYASGKHGSEYIDKKALRAHFEEWDRILCLEIAKRFSGHRVEVIIGPSQGGIAVGMLVALHLQARYGERVFVLNADKNPDDDFVLTPSDIKILQGKRVLIVEDIINNGTSVKKVIELMRRYAREIVGLGVAVNRGGDAIKTVDLPADSVFAVENVELDSWSEEECPLCAQGVPINTDYGHGKEFLKKKAQEEEQAGYSHTQEYPPDPLARKTGRRRGGWPPFRR